MKVALMVENNDHNMKLITYILKENGYGTLSAGTGQ